MPSISYFSRSHEAHFNRGISMNALCALIQYRKVQSYAFLHIIKTLSLITFLSIQFPREAGISSHSPRRLRICSNFIINISAVIIAICRGSSRDEFLKILVKTLSIGGEHRHHVIRYRIHVLHDHRRILKKAFRYNRSRVYLYDDWDL